MSRHLSPPWPVTTALLGILVGVSLVGVIAPIVAGASTGGPADQTLVVDDDGEDCSAAEFQTIQAAVDNASAGATVRVCAGNYTENVVVTTANLTIRADGHAILNDTGTLTYGKCGSDKARRKYTGFEIQSSQTTVRGFDIRNYQLGIWVHEATDTNLRNNEIALRPRAESEDCSQWGIHIENAPRTLVQDTTILREYISIRVENSPRTVIRNNDMSTGLRQIITVLNSDNIRITGNVLANWIWIRSSNESVIRRNTIEDGDIMVGGPNTTGTRIRNNTLHDGGIIVNTSHATILNNSVGVTNPDGEYWGSHAGITLFRKADHSVIGNNTVHQQPEAGIYARSTDNVTISSNSVTASRFGVLVKGNATADVTGNTIARNTDGIVVCGGVDDCDMSRRRQPSVTVRNNDIRSNLNSGIRIWNNIDTNRMQVTNNRFQDNGNFTIMNDGKGDLNTTGNSVGTPTSTEVGAPHKSPTEKPEPGFGVVTGVVGLVVSLSLLARRRRRNPGTREQ